MKRRLGALLAARRPSFSRRQRATAAVRGRGDRKPSELEAVSTASKNKFLLGDHGLKRGIRPRRRHSARRCPGRAGGCPGCRLKVPKRSTSRSHRDHSIGMSIMWLPTIFNVYRRQSATIIAQENTRMRLIPRQVKPRSAQAAAVPGFILADAEPSRMRLTLTSWRAHIDVIHVALGHTEGRRHRAACRQPTACSAAYRFQQCATTRSSICVAAASTDDRGVPYESAALGWTSGSRCAPSAGGWDEKYMEVSSPS